LKKWKSYDIIRMTGNCNVIAILDYRNKIRRRNYE